MRKGNPMSMRLLSLILTLFSSGLLTGQQIDKVEYFIDTDPGFGNGTHIPVSPNTNIDVETSISIAGINSGIHTIYFRVCDTSGVWSFIQKRTFLKDLIETPIQRDIVSMEYFFDIDPGEGNGNALSFSQNTEVEIIDGLDLSQLENGIHTLYIRALDEFGNWSFIQKRTFLKDDCATKKVRDITHVEYFIDNDPGEGNGISLPGLPGKDINRDTTISLNDLDCGVHTFYIRAQNEMEKWSFLQKRTFLFDDQRIEFAQFKFDSIPSYTDWTNSNPFDKDFDIIADIDFEGICDLEPGWYHIDARVRRQKSWWSDEYTDSIEIKNFYDQTGVVIDQFGNPIPDAQIEVQGIGNFSTTLAGEYAFSAPKCWGDTVSFFKDSVYSAQKSYVLDNPVLNYSPHHILGDIDSSLYGYKCINVSGVTGNTNLRYLCEGATQNTIRSGEVIDTGSVAGFILHDGMNTLGTIYEMNTTGSFTNDGSYPQNQKLYISPVVGRPGSPELINVDHECTDIMLPGKPIVFLNVVDSVFLKIDSMGHTVGIDADTLLAGPCVNCDIQSQTLSQTSFDCNDHGINVEQLMIDNGIGNSASCSVIVQVDDFIEPTISCRTDTMVFTDPGICGFTALGSVLDPAESWDNCLFTLDNDFNNSSSLNGELIPPGIHLITWTIDDNHGNTANCNYTITVEDNENPTINCPSDLTIEIGPGECDTAFIYSVTSSDNCLGQSITLTSGIGSGGPFPIGGPYLEQYKVTDAHSNEVNCSFSVYVRQLKSEIQDTICFGDSLFLENAWRYLPGMYFDTFPNSNGCDSLVITTLDTTTICIWPSEIVYVDSSAIGENTGVDWDNAYVDMQLALDVANRYLNVLQVWCAAGTYFPTANVNRSASFNLVDSLFVLGGFEGVEIDSADRDYNTYKSILSGDIGVKNNHADNSFHVVRIDSLKTTVLDGFTIQDGNANGIEEVDQSGGGILNFGQLKLKNSTIHHCSSVGLGSMIRNDGASSDLLIQNVILTGNGTVFILNINGAKVKFHNMNEIRLNN